MNPSYSKSILFTFLLLLAFCFHAHTQKNFQDGYVILRNGDTLKGQIDYRQWETTPRSIVFRETATDRNTAFLPEELRSFYVSGEKYKAGLVKIYPYSTDATAFTSTFFDATPYEKAVFLRSVTEGRVNLYNYKDTLTGADYFFTSLTGSKEEPQQLRLISSIEEVNGHNMFQLRETYKDQLSVDLADCQTASELVRRTPYRENALRKLIFSYDHCGTDTVEKEEKGKGLLVKFIVMAGYCSTKIQFSGPAAFAPLGDFPAYGTVTGGAGALFILPGNRQKYAVLIDGLYQHFYSKSGLYRSSTYINNDDVLDYNIVKADLQFRYRYPSRRIRPFIQGGISNNFATGNKSYTDTYTLPGNTHYQDAFLGGDFRKYALGFLAGIGAETGHFSLEFRLERNPGISDATSVSSPVTALSLLAAFSL